MDEKMLMFQAMGVNKARIERLFNSQAEGKEIPYDVNLLMGIYYDSRKGRVFNGSQLLTVESDESKQFKDFEGNVINKKVNVDAMDKLNDEFKPTVTFNLEYESFLNVLRVFPPKGNLVIYAEYDKKNAMLNFYKVDRATKDIRAKVDLVNRKVPDNFDYVAIHNYRNLYEIFALNEAEELNIEVDVENSLMKLTGGKVELLMGCNAERFQLIR